MYASDEDSQATQYSAVAAENMPIKPMPSKLKGFFDHQTFIPSVFHNGRQRVLVKWEDVIELLKKRGGSKCLKYSDLTIETEVPTGLPEGGWDTIFLVVSLGHVYKVDYAPDNRFIVYYIKSNPDEQKLRFIVGGKFIIEASTKIGAHTVWQPALSTIVELSPSHFEAHLGIFEEVDMDPLNANPDVETPNIVAQDFILRKQVDTLAPDLLLMSKTLEERMLDDPSTVRFEEPLEAHPAINPAKNATRSSARQVGASPVKDGEDPAAKRADAALQLAIIQRRGQAQEFITHTKSIIKRLDDNGVITTNSRVDLLEPAKQSWFTRLKETNAVLQDKLARLGQENRSLRAQIKILDNPELKAKHDLEVTVLLTRAEKADAAVKHADDLTQDEIAKAAVIRAELKDFKQKYHELEISAAVAEAKLEQLDALETRRVRPRMNSTPGSAGLGMMPALPRDVQYRSSP